MAWSEGTGNSYHVEAKEIWVWVLPGWEATGYFTCRYIMEEKKDVNVITSEQESVFLCF